MELVVVLLGFIFAFPSEIFLNVPGEEGEENPDHQGVVDDPDPRQGVGDKVEGIHQVDQSKKSTHQSTGWPTPIATGEKVPKHGGGGSKQPGKVGELGTGTQGIQDGLMIPRFPGWKRGDKGQN